MFTIYFENVCWQNGTVNNILISYRQQILRLVIERTSKSIFILNCYFSRRPLFICFTCSKSTTVLVETFWQNKYHWWFCIYTLNCYLGWLTEDPSLKTLFHPLDARDLFKKINHHFFIVLLYKSFQFTNTLRTYSYNANTINEWTNE